MLRRPTSAPHFWMRSTELSPRCQPAPLAKLSHRAVIVAGGSCDATGKRRGSGPVSLRPVCHRSTSPVFARGPDMGQPWWIWCIKWTSSQPLLRKCHNDKFPDSCYALIRNTIHYIHLIHQSNGEPLAEYGPKPPPPAAKVSVASVLQSARSSIIAGGHACRTAPRHGSHAHPPSLARGCFGGSVRCHRPLRALSD